MAGFVELEAGQGTVHNNALPSKTVHSIFRFLADISTLVMFFKSDFALQIRISPESSKREVGMGDNSLDSTSLKSTSLPLACIPITL